MNDSSGWVALWLVLTVGFAAPQAVAGIHGRVSVVGRCEATCKPRGEVHMRESGVCVCRDGSSWVWQEGYTFRLGGAK